LVKDGFKLVKKGTTREITTKVIAEMEAQMLAGTNSRHVADVLSKVFENANDNWERLARSEMAMAAETAKIDEFKAEGIARMHYYAAFDACPICLPLEGDYDINDVPLPVRDTHPRCYCTLGPVIIDS
jgi:SPP1 gp7 family putative phage head morphogenesis protein